MNNACDFSVWEKFNLLGCLHQLAFGWVPDWFWVILPYWPWIVVIGGAGMAYRFAGWPGVAAFAGGVGFIFGRNSVKPSEPIEQIPDDHPEFGVNKKTRPKAQVKKLPSGPRRFNPDTNKWEG